MSAIQNTVRCRIRTLRESRGLSQSELAKEIHMSQGSITAYETGTRRPDLDTLYAIAKALYVPFSAFFEDYSITYFSQVDMERLKAFYQNEKLVFLFDKIRYLSESDIDLVLAIVNRIK